MIMHCAVHAFIFLAVNSTRHLQVRVDHAMSFVMEKEMDGNSQREEQTASQQNGMDREKIATLLRNAIQIVNSGSIWGSGNTSSEQSQSTGLGLLQPGLPPRPMSSSNTSRPQTTGTMQANCTFLCAIQIWLVKLPSVSGLMKSVL